MKRLIGSNPSSSPWIYVSPESFVHRTIRIRSSDHGDRSFFLFSAHSRHSHTAVRDSEKVYISRVETHKSQADRRRHKFVFEFFSSEYFDNTTSNPTK
jgi:hypothetical protein